MRMMKPYRFRLFERAILVRMEAEQASKEEILADYPRLSEEEKEELRKAIPERLD